MERGRRESELESEGVGRSPLSALGLSDREGSLYRLVLRNSGASLADLARRLSTTTARLEEDLQPLIALGLVIVQAGEPATVVADVLERTPVPASGALPRHS